MTTSTHRLGDALPGSGSSTGRFGRLAESVRELRTRAAGGRRDQWLLILGGLLMPIGVLLIVLGWVGASQTPLPFEQTSYLISGGILGLGLTVAGGFIYFAYWQSLRIRESREQTKQLADALGRLELLLGGGAATTVAGTLRPSTHEFVATPNGSIFHRPDCSVVAGRTDLSGVNPAKTKLEPCRICNPLETTAS
ncbi:MAG TPA: hypothetical protein VFT62_04160 [Mycobacteriales bacterium]|nr:hypothetical protein [Mycobacteriales bacterium]